MDIEKLIERLKNNRHPNGLKSQAATALSTLHAENEKLRTELDDLRIQWDMYGGDVGITAVYKELEQVKRERDAAVKAIERVRSCKDCWHYTGEWTPPCKECQDSEEHHPYFKWRSQRED